MAMYTKAHNYNELEFRVYNIELRMEFYLWVVRKFCLPGGSILSIFGGGKITCAAMVSSESARVELISCAISYHEMAVEIVKFGSSPWMN